MFERQHTPEQLTEYEVARELIGRRLGELLRAEDAAADDAERERLIAEQLRLTQLRADMKVGSDEAHRVVADATAAREAQTQQ